MFLQDLIHTLHLRAIAGSMRDALLFFAALFVVIYLLEAGQGADKKRYLSRSFAVDVFYSLFYGGGSMACGSTPPVQCSQTQVGGS